MSSPTRDWAATTFVVDSGRTLLLWHRKSQAWLPPGGHVEADELPDEAAVREVREETGLQVALLGGRQAWGKVTALHRPACLLLEPIRSGHEHIDLIYFARVVGGSLAVSAQEAADHRWCTAADLEGDDIAEDIRILGLQALEACAGAPGGPVV